MNKIALNSIKIVTGLIIIVGAILYFIQENLIFYPEKLEENYQFNFNQEFEELNFKASDEVLINGLLFKADSAKGLVFFLHGNAGSLRIIGEEAKTYTDLNYDVFMLDYRGFGKSEGTINSQAQLFKDNQLVYDALLKKYEEKNIIILGYSIGTGMASKLASDNNPKKIILQAPYYSLIDLLQYKTPFLPTFILKYKFKTNEYLKKINIPIIVFHGKQDEVIYYESSLKLKEELQDKIELFILENQGHIDIIQNSIFKKEIERILE